MDMDYTSNDAGSSPTYYLLFSSVVFLLLFTTLSYKTAITYFEWRWQSDFGVSILVTTYLLVHVIMAVTEVRRPSGLLKLSRIAVPLTFQPFVVASKTSLDLPFSPPFFKRHLLGNFARSSNCLRASSVPRNKLLKCAAFFSHSNRSHRMTALYLCRSVSFAFSTNYFSISLLKYKVWLRTMHCHFWRRISSL